MPVLTIKTVHRIEEFPCGDWEQVFPKVVENYSFFKALDDAQFAEFRFFYILVYENNVPIGATTCFLMQFPLDLAVEGPLSSLLKPFKKYLTPKVLICGMPIGQGRVGILKEPKMVLAAIQEEMELIAQKEKASIIGFKDFNSTYKSLLDENLDKDFFRLDSFPSTDMTISYKSFDDYLASLSSVTRSGVKRKLKKADEKKEITLEITNKLDESTLKEVYALYLQTYEKNEMSLEKLTADFFPAISRHMPHETKIFIWRVKGKVAAFAFCLARGDYFIDYYGSCKFQMGK